MRRQDRKITDKKRQLELLQNAEFGTLSLTTPEGPYGVPMNYGFTEDALFLHCAHSGRKIDAIKHNPMVSFCVVNRAKIEPGEKACKWTSRYSSIILTGKASIIEDEDQKTKALNHIMDHYGGQLNNFDEKLLKQTAVIHIDIEEISGKENV